MIFMKLREFLRISVVKNPDVLESNLSRWTGPKSKSAKNGLKWPQLVLKMSNIAPIKCKDFHENSENP